MLAQLLGKHGLKVRVEGPDALSASNIDRLDPGAALVCLSYLDSRSPAHMRYTVRRLRGKLPSIRVMLGCWLIEGDVNHLGEQVKAENSHHIERSRKVLRRRY
jgi:hypothetical protein